MEAVVKATPILYSKFTCIIYLFIYLFIYLWIHSCKMTIKENNKHKSKWNCKTSRDIADRCLHCKHYCGVSIFIECFMFKSPCLIDYWHFSSYNCTQWTVLAIMATQLWALAAYYSISPLRTDLSRCNCNAYKVDRPSRLYVGGNRFTDDHAACCNV